MLVAQNMDDFQNMFQKINIACFKVELKINTVEGRL